MPNTSMPSSRPRIGSRPRSRSAKGGVAPNRSMAVRDARKPPSTFLLSSSSRAVGVHDVAVEDDSALDVADFADNDRPEMQASANSRRDTEFEFKFVRCLHQFVAHCHKAAQGAAIDRAALLTPGHDHFVADIIKHFAAIVRDRKGKQAERTVEQAVNADSTEPLCQTRRARNIHEQHEAIFLDRRVISPGDEVEEGAISDDVGNSETQVHDNRKHRGIGEAGPEYLV